jgi:hypothetical protein
VVWGEAYAKPGATFEKELSSTITVKARASAVASWTIGRDVFASRDQAAVTLEDAFVALRGGNAEQGLQLDISAGSQPYKIGSGMLISDGGVDGFERGTLIFGPRQAWSMAALARATHKKFSFELFHLDPRELGSGDSKTRMRGGKIEYSFGKDRHIGLVYGHVPKSEAPYAQAAPGGLGAPAIILNGRDGLSFWHGYGVISPMPQKMPGFSIAFDYVRQSNERIDLKASGGRIELSNTFVKSKWLPTIA